MIFMETFHLWTAGLPDSNLYVTERLQKPKQTPEFMFPSFCPQAKWGTDWC